MKVFNDPVHGSIELPDICVRIIDTPWFQRLRNIQQQNGVYYVYPGANHCRFEHSIGTCHLAGLLIRSLKMKWDKDWRERQPDQKKPMEITERDIICVQIAALCHDIGHGPFSHWYDMYYRPLIEDCAAWTHEEMGSLVFAQIYKDLKDKELNVFLNEEGKPTFLEKDDLLFIQNAIMCAEDRTANSEEEKKKLFLYQIVNNETNKIDVDKWDYFARDCQQLGFKNYFDHNRFIQFARIVKTVNGDYEICMRDKEVQCAFDMFSLRNQLHRRACQHKTVNAINLMMADAFKLAEEGEFVTDGQKLSADFLEKSVTDDKKTDIWKAFLYATDHIQTAIPQSPLNSPKMTEAKDLLKRIDKRELYYRVCEVSIVDAIIKGLKTNKRTLVSEITQYVVNEVNKIVEKNREADSASKLHNIETADIVIDIITFDFGDKLNNPVKKLKVYSKENPMECRLLKDDEMPKAELKTMIENVVRVFYKGLNRSVGELLSKTVKLVASKTKQVKQDDDDDGCPRIEVEMAATPGVSSGSGGDTTPGTLTGEAACSAQAAQQMCAGSTGNVAGWYVIKLEQI